VTRFHVLFRVVVALVVLVLAISCSGDGGGEARPAETPAQVVPWSIAEGLAASRRGEYREVVVVASGSGAQPLVEEWVAFDLDAAVVDRTIAVHYSPDGASSSQTPTRENPSMRIIYTQDSAYMWTSWTEARCGAPWVEMPPEQIAADTGMDIEATDLLVVEPLDVLRSVDPGEPVSSDGHGSVYEVTVPGGTGLGVSSFLAAHPDMVERIVSQEHSAEVRLARDGGQVEITVDLSEVASELVRAAGQGAGEDVGMTVRWTVTTPQESVATTVPPDTVDRTSCA
jgi:hypothetical protein